MFTRIRTRSSRSRPALGRLLAVMSLTFLSLPAGRASARPGDLDPSFGEGGFAVIRPASGWFVPNAIEIQPDGKVLVAAGLNEGSFSRFVTIRFDQAGRPDSGFGTRSNPGVLETRFDAHSWATDVLVQPDGKIVTVGSTAPGTSGTRSIAVARHRIDGSLDPAFGSGGRMTLSVPTAQSSFASAVALAPDGRIVIAGWANLSAGRSAAVVARLRADGSRDSSLDGDGFTLVELGKPTGASAVAVREDGRIVLAGELEETIDGFAEPRWMFAARLNVDGSPDATFRGRPKDRTGTHTWWINVSGQALQHRVKEIRLEADGGMTVFGSACQGEAVDCRPVVVRLGPGGEQRGGFLTRGRTPSASVFTGVAAQGDGKLVMAANGSSLNDLVLWRYDSAGRLDTGFSGKSGRVHTRSAAITPQAGVAIQNDSIFVAGMDHGSVANGWRNALFLARFTGAADAESLLDESRLFLAQQFRDFTYREATSAELDVLVESMAAGESRESTLMVVSELDRKAQSVIRLHLAGTGVAPSHDALMAAVDQLRDGRKTLLEVADGVVQRMRKVAGVLTDEEFIRAVFRNTTGRSPSPRELRAALGSLGKGRTTRASVLLEGSRGATFVRATESEVFVVRAVSAMLKFVPAAGYVQFAAAAIEEGLVTPEWVISSLLADPAYRGRFFPSPS